MRGSVKLKTLANHVLLLFLVLPTVLLASPADSQVLDPVHVARDYGDEPKVAGSHRQVLLKWTTHTIFALRLPIERNSEAFERCAVSNGYTVIDVPPSALWGVEVRLGAKSISGSEVRSLLEEMNKHGLSGLSITGLSRLNSDHLSAIADHKTITRLRIDAGAWRSPDDVSVAPEWPRALSALVDLQELVLANYPTLTDDDVSRCIEKLTKLRTLSLSGATNIGQKSCKAIGGLRDISSLTIKTFEGTYAALNDESIRELWKAKALTVVRIGPAPLITSQAFIGVGDVAGLQEFDLLDCDGVDDQFLERIRLLKQLHAISLERSDGIKGEEARDLECAGTLKLLNVNHCGKISAKLLKQLTNRPLIEFRAWAVRALNDDHLAAVCQPACRVLVLNECESITNSGLGSLPNCKYLEHLEIRSCSRVTGEKLASIVPTLARLKYLDAGGIRDISDANIASISARKTLIELYLHDCSKISGGSIEYFCKMKQLKRLDLSGCSGILREDAAAIRECLAGCIFSHTQEPTEEYR